MDRRVVGRQWPKAVHQVAEDGYIVLPGSIGTASGDNQGARANLAMAKPLLPGHLSAMHWDRNINLFNLGQA